MRDHIVKIEEHIKNHTSSAGEEISELGLVLQIYQDLTKLDPVEQEDILVRNILMQILLNYYENEKSIPVPAEYETEEQKKTIDYYDENQK